jgi:hypothetical protein
LNCWAKEVKELDYDCLPHCCIMCKWTNVPCMILGAAIMSLWSPTPYSGDIVSRNVVLLHSLSHMLDDKNQIAINMSSELSQRSKMGGVEWECICSDLISFPWLCGTTNMVINHVNGPKNSEWVFLVSELDSDSGTTRRIWQRTKANNTRIAKHLLR